MDNWLDGRMHRLLDKEFRRERIQLKDKEFDFRYLECERPKDLFNVDV